MTIKNKLLSISASVSALAPIALVVSCNSGSHKTGEEAKREVADQILNNYENIYKNNNTLSSLGVSGVSFSIDAETKEEVRTEVIKDLAGKDDAFVQKLIEYLKDTKEATSAYISGNTPNAASGVSKLQQKYGSDAVQLMTTISNIYLKITPIITKSLTKNISGSLNLG
ncbi:hypothetical protein ACXYRR_02365 [Mycoplasma sp. 246B]